MAGTQTTILVVDDDPDILEAVADFLRLNDYDVMIATNGNEGLQAMQREVPDLVISDIAMPEVDGYQFYERIRLNPAWGTIPFIFMSAKGEQVDVRLGVGMGADAYLIKPFEPEDLQIAVHSRLRRVQDIEAAAKSGLENMKQQLLRVFSHELRTPLTYVYGYLTLIKEDRSQLSDEDIDDMLTGMERGTKRLMRLVEDLLILMRIESGAAEFEIKRYRTHTELKPLVEQVVAEYPTKPDNIEIEISVPDDLTVYCLSSHLKDAVGRLLDNAVKFSKIQGGCVAITAEGGPDYVQIAVIDEGIGIDPSEQPNIFQRFQQVDRDTLEQQGLGLGLAIAGGLIELHNGSISVESSPNEGSVFTITLPVYHEG